MRRLFLISLALIALTFSALAQAKHPFTFDDMMKLKRVGEPQVSPDGKWVIFSVVDVDLAANTKTPHVWIVPTARMWGRPPRPSSRASSAELICRSGRRPPPLGAGWQALRISLEQRRRLAGLDCGV